MYNSLQLGYILGSLGLTILILILAGKLIKTSKNKNRFLLFWAWVTFLTHISVMWVDYLANGSAQAPDSVLFPIYFCNACMYTLMVVSLLPNKKGKLFYYLATFVAYAGTFGALITLFESHYFADLTSAYTFGNFKSMLSHSFMLVGCLYLFVGKYVKIKVSNLIPYAYGLLGCFVLGNFINWLFEANGLPNPNSMYLVKSALDSVPLFTGYFLAAVMVVLISLFTMIWEQFAYKKGQRWYNSIATIFKNKTIVEKVGESVTEEVVEETQV